MMTMVIIVPIIIINIISGMSIPNTQSRPKSAGGNHRKQTHPRTTPQHREGGSNPPPHYTTEKEAGGYDWGGRGGRGGRTGIMYA